MTEFCLLMPMRSANRRSAAGVVRDKAPDGARSGVDGTGAAGHRLAYLSNMPEELAQWIERDHPFNDWFELGVFSARVQHVKPDESIFLLAHELLELAGQAPVFVDDMLANVQTAQRMGWRAVHFQNAAQVRNQLEILGILNTTSEKTLTG